MRFIDGEVQAQSMEVQHRLKTWYFRLERGDRKKLENSTCVACLLQMTSL